MKDSKKAKNKHDTYIGLDIFRQRNMPFNMQKILEKRKVSLYCCRALHKTMQGSQARI